jgi:F0F1-type ATP synthase assembly protein I
VAFRCSLGEFRTAGLRYSPAIAAFTYIVHRGFPMAVPREDRVERGEALRQLGGLLSLGGQLAGAITGFGLVGYWIDGTYGTGSLWTTILLFLGAIGGMYSFIRTVMRAGRRQFKEHERTHED